MSDAVFIAFIVVQTTLVAACAYWTGYAKAHDEMFDRLTVQVTAGD